MQPAAKQPLDFATAWRRLKSRRGLVRTYFEILYLKRQAAYRSQNPHYEQHRDAAFSVLDGRRFGTGLEVGCGEGFTTHRIAALCDSVVACDVSLIAVRRARKLNAHLERVEFRQHDLARDPLQGDFDYMFCGEVLYYLRLDQLDRAADVLVDRLREGGVLHLMHHRAKVEDGVGFDKDFGAKTIHDLFAERGDLRVDVDEDHGPVRVTVLSKATA